MFEEMIFEVQDPAQFYSEKDLLFKREVYNIIGRCFDVHNELGPGFNEAVYKDALAVEFAEQNIPFEREKPFDILYKGKKLSRQYFCDFIIDDNIIIEVKAQGTLIEANSAQLLNYLAASKCRLGLLINFGEKSLKFKRYIL
jgi:GxxExxY protein